MFRVALSSKHVTSDFLRSVSVMLRDKSRNKEFNDVCRFREIRIGQWICALNLIAEFSKELSAYLTKVPGNITCVSTG